MRKMKKFTYIILIIILLTVFVLNGLAINRQVYAVRSIANDLSNLVNYPSIYTLVRELQVAHPTWNFTILYTGLDWDNVIYNETLAKHTRSLVSKYTISGDPYDWVCSVCGLNGTENQDGWYCASAKTVSYYMDPRNWLNETYIFSMESLMYDPSIQTLEGVKKILEGTFMDVDQISYIDTNGNTQIISKSYAQLFMEAAQKYNVSPYALASRVRQEQGTSGSSPLISGQYTYTDPETGDQTVFTGYYNYFNIGASGDETAEIIKNGLTYAQNSNRNWTTPELAILGGANFYASYVNRYQDSNYLQKYQVDPAGGTLFSLQYMQNVYAPYSEGITTRKAYIDMGLLESDFNFIIPVFENMPATASPIPGVEETTPTVVDGNVIVITQYYPLTIRSGPGTSYSAVGSAPIGAILTRTEKATSPDASGIYWDKIIYNSGTETITGYVTREYLREIETTVANEQMITTEMCNLRTAQGTTDSKVIQLLQQGTQVTVIAKSTLQANGHTWYKVELEDGTQGYVSAAFLQEGTDEKYKIDGEYIKIAPGTKISDISGATLTGTTLKTGATVTLDETAYTLVVLGDVNGDGQITPLDYVKVKNHIMKVTALNDAYKQAADTTGDGQITPLDYVKIKNHIMNVSKIYI